MSKTTKRTGRTRFREHKRFLRASLLVLQIEWRTTGTSHIHDSLGDTDEVAVDYLEWLDATVSDTNIAVFKE